jgi:hypothetical protein
MLHQLCYLVFADAASWLCQDFHKPPLLLLLQVSSYSMALAMESEVVGGPTAQGQPAFEWGDKWDDFAHRGMPNRCEHLHALQACVKLATAL